MKQLSVVLVGCLICACGPSYDAERVMTPEERIQEQERLAYEAEQNEKKNGNQSEVPLEDPEDEVKSFDVTQAELEIRRATLSAVTCPETAQKPPKGVGEVTVVFKSDGSVRDASVNTPFAGSNLEDCVLNAYRNIVVPPFKEPEHTMTWKVDLTGKKQDLMPKEEDEVAKALAGPEKEEGKECKDPKDPKTCKESKDKDKDKKSSKK